MKHLPNVRKHPHRPHQMQPYRRYAFNPELDLRTQPAPPPTRELPSHYGSFLEEAIKELCSQHSQEILFGRVSPTPDPTWRSERIFLASAKETLKETLAARSSQVDDIPRIDFIDVNARFSTRVYLFEQDPNCHSGEIRPGRFIGYVVIRPLTINPKIDDINDAYNAILGCYLTPPRRLQRTRYHILTMMAGASEGILPFPCTPYYRPHSVLSEPYAFCMLSSLHTSLLLTSQSFGSRPITPTEIYYILRENNWIAPTLSVRHALMLFSSEEIAANAILEIFLPRLEPDRPPSAAITPYSLPSRDAGPKYAIELISCISAYLTSGLPLILAANFVDWTSIAPNLAVENRNDLNGHAVLIVGMHTLAGSGESIEHAEPTRIDSYELPGRFVIHDPAADAAPYVEWTANELLQRADILSPGDEGLALLAIGPSAMEHKLTDLRFTALQLWNNNPEVASEYESYLKAAYNASDQIQNSTRATPWIVERFLTLKEAMNSYELNDLTEHEREQLIAQYAQGKPAAWWWAIELHASEDLNYRLEARPGFPPPQPGAVFLWAQQRDLQSSPIVRKQRMAVQPTIVLTYPLKGIRVHRIKRSFGSNGGLASAPRDWEFNLIIPTSGI